MTSFAKATKMSTASTWKLLTNLCTKSTLRFDDSRSFCSINIDNDWIGKRYGVGSEIEYMISRLDLAYYLLLCWTLDGDDGDGCSLGLRWQAAPSPAEIFMIKGERRG